MQKSMSTDFSESETFPNGVSSQLSLSSDEAQLQLLKVPGNHFSEKVSENRRENRGAI